MGPILCRAKFEGNVGHLKSDVEQIGFAATRAQISVLAETKTNIISLIVGEEFGSAIFNVDNVAERALVHALVEGAAKLAGREPGEQEHAALVDEIIPDHSARQMHAFRGRHFRDYVQHTLPSSSITIDVNDGAMLKLGLGWRVHPESSSGNIEGKSNCISFLNRLVREIEDELCGELRQLDRLATIDFALRNHEAAIGDRARWSRTAAAVLSLHDDKDVTLATMAEHDFELNAVFLATRLLVEIALCECPLVFRQ